MAIGGDIGGPMNLTEEYRWNIKTISYGFDRTFIEYFGQRGVEEVNKAIAILNNLPAASKMSPTLSEFPTDTRRENSRALALNLIDLKSAALGMLVEEMGLADPERYTWCLRTHTHPAPDTHLYSVIQRNFDPVTWAPSKYVNGTLYTYTIIVSAYGDDLSDAIESTVDPLAPVGTAVASFQTGINYGIFYTGLTRDDVGGIRYMLRPNNYNYENLLPDMLPAGGGPWAPVDTGTNAVSTNSLVNLALRPGVDKIVFKQVKNDSVVGYIRAVTNKYTDTYILNGKKFTQKVQRVLASGTTNGVVAGIPDIIFTAGDLANAIASRESTANWQNNANLNTQIGFGITSGPGVIQPPIVITFNNVGEFNFNESPGFLDEANLLAAGFAWGSFDGSTNAPVVYPNTKSIEELEDKVLGGGN